ncbi:MAG: TolC family protein [Bacteriovoracia bacterium]
MYLLISLFALYASPAFAQKNDCSKIANYHDFYHCTLERHPRMSLTVEKRREGEAALSKSGQWINPAITLKSVGGSLAGESSGSTEVDVSFPISQLWTRGSQKAVGSAEKRLAEVEADVSLSDLKKELLKDLFRLRQIEDDYEMVNETLDTFGTIQKQLQGRRARGPEQEITLSLLQLASSDYQLKRNHVQVERGEIFSKLKAIWGNDFEVKRNYFPPIRDRWPEINAGTTSGHSLALQKSIAESEKASAEYSLAKFDSLPTIAIGPSLERSTSGPQRTWSYGFNVTASLPIFSWNGGGKDLARSRAIQADLESSYTEKKFQYEKDVLVQKYKSAVESLAKGSGRQDIKKKHHQIDSYFKQGLASGAVVIEAHRQIGEYMESQHEHENAAIESYIELMTLTGGDIEGILQ